jgi:hypothetical protein
MEKITSNRLKSAATSALLVALAALLLTACGGSSKGSTSAGTKTASVTGGQPDARATALRTCLQKAGITLPERKPGRRGTPGAGRPFGGSGAVAAAKLPNGVSRAQLQAALKKCGGGQFPQGGRGLAAGGAQRFAKFASCMRKHGVKLPQPNTSGKGPIFNTKGIDTKSAAFKAADAKCAGELAPSGVRPGGAPGSDTEAGPPGKPQGDASAGAPPGQ